MGGAGVGAVGGAASGAGGGGGAGAASSTSGAGSGGAIVLLAQVQFMAMSAQSNVELPEAYTTFSSNFAWANLQFPEHVFGRWDPLDQANSSDYDNAAGEVSDGGEEGSGEGAASRDATSRRRHRRRRLEWRRQLQAGGEAGAAAAGSSAASEECFAVTLANDVPSNVTALNASLAPGVAAENATRETTRDGTTAYLAALHTSAERLFLSNLLVLSCVFTGLVAFHLTLLWILRKRAQRDGKKWTAPVALAFPSWELALLVVAFQGITQSCVIVLRVSECSIGYQAAALFAFVTIPGAFLFFSAIFVVRMIKVKQVIRYQKLSLAAKHEAKSNLRDACCRRAR